MPRVIEGPRSRTAFLASVIVLAASTVGAQTPAAAAPEEPSSPFVVSVRYRGRPPGVPRAEDLEAIREQGFAAIDWPISEAKALSEVTRLAQLAGLAVNLRGEYATMSHRGGVRSTRVVLAVRTMPVAELVPFAWRAIAQGARELDFDSGATVGAGLVDAKGDTQPWTFAAADLARQLRINGALFLRAAPGPTIVPVSSVPPAFDAVLLDAGRSWVLIATNLSRGHAVATIRFPADVPYALWLDILSGSTMAMLSQPVGPRWTVDLEAWGTRVYVIDKTLK